MWQLWFCYTVLIHKPGANQILSSLHRLLQDQCTICNGTGQVLFSSTLPASHTSAFNLDYNLATFSVFNVYALPWRSWDCSWGILLSLQGPVPRALCFHLSHCSLAPASYNSVFPRFCLCHSVAFLSSFRKAAFAVKPEIIISDHIPNLSPALICS